MIMLNKRRLTRFALRMFDAWGISDSDISEVLNVRLKDVQSARRNRFKFKSQSIVIKLIYLFCIRSHLHTLYPNQPDLFNSWMSQPNKAFGDKSAVSIIKKSGLAGLKQVRQYLIDCY